MNFPGRQTILAACLKSSPQCIVIVLSLLKNDGSSAIQKQCLKCKNSCRKIFPDFTKGLKTNVGLLEELSEAEGLLKKIAKESTSS
jgi:hypothetical protein